MNPFSHTGLSISDSLKSVRKSVLIYETIIHAVASMVTDQYSHILDDDRKSNAARLEEAFYSGKDLNPDVQRNTPDAESADPSDASDAPGINQELLLKILANPEMANLLTALAKSLK